ncbi:GTP cyclohydrolase II [Meiothermus sp. QL-1]|nr:GTP cyclohydrolase II [Meiothermus sp. QL-1]
MSPIPELLAELRAGRPIILLDDERRENEGDLVVAAEHATPEVINLMIREGRGLVCLALTAERARALELQPMVPQNTDPHATAFTVSVDHVSCGTGISAYDRAKTVRACLDPATRPSDLRRPGHIFPLVARPGGVLERPGHTEAAVDLARLAGLEPAGVICEVVAEDGRMARRPELEALARRLGLKLGTIRDLIAYRWQSEPLVDLEVETRLPTPYATFRLLGFRERVSGREHLALVLGEDLADPLVRLHSECLTGDALHSLRCDCRAQLEAAMRLIAQEGQGIILYMRQEGRGIGLLNKLRAYALQDQGLDTVEANERLGFPADAREYHAAVQILRHLGIGRLRLLSNNPHKAEALRAAGLEVRRLPLQVGQTPHNQAYLTAKRAKLGHFLGELHAVENAPR